MIGCRIDTKPEMCKAGLVLLIIFVFVCLPAVLAIEYVGEVKTFSNLPPFNSGVAVSQKNASIGNTDGKTLNDAGRSTEALSAYYRVFAIDLNYDATQQNRMTLSKTSGQGFMIRPLNDNMIWILSVKPGLSREENLTPPSNNKK